jgi:hypothetical protein
MESGFCDQLVPGDGTLTPMRSLALAIRSLPQVTIAKLRGRLRGGGNELAMAAGRSRAPPITTDELAVGFEGELDLEGAIERASTATS